MTAFRFPLYPAMLNFLLWVVPACDIKTHYIAVSSDRHSTTDAIKIAMSNMPDSVEYVCLNGDMPNPVRRTSGKYAVYSSFGFPPQPYVQTQEAYNTSTVLQEVQGVFPKLTNKNVSIIYASHDANATDDAGIMKCADPATLPTSTGADYASVSQGRSGLIYTGFDGDKPAYYIYGVSYYDTMNPGEDTDDSVPEADLPEGRKKTKKLPPTGSDIRQQRRCKNQCISLSLHQNCPIRSGIWKQAKKYYIRVKPMVRKKGVTYSGTLTQ